MTIWLQPEIIILLLLAPCVGSFLGLLIERLPSGRPVIWSRSVCPHCGGTLRVRDLVPLVSWLANHGRCRMCAERLSLFYPLIEILSLLIALWALAVVPGWLVWVTSGLGWTLLTLAIIDWRYLVLPDSLTLPLIPIGLLIAWILSQEQLLAHVVGTVAGFLMFWAVAHLYRHMRNREGLGLGDAKLLAATGAWLGWQALTSVVLIAAASALAAALLQGRRLGSLDAKRPLPFGPYLAFGFWLVWLYGPLA